LDGRSEGRGRETLEGRRKRKRRYRERKGEGLVGQTTRTRPNASGVLYNLVKVGLELKETEVKPLVREPSQKEGTMNANSPQLKALVTV